METTAKKEEEREKKTKTKKNVLARSLLLSFLFSHKKTTRHWIPSPSPGFFEPISSTAAIALLPDPAYIVWASKKDVREFERESGSKFAFPVRGKEKSSGKSSKEELPSASPSTTAEQLAALAELAAALRGDADEARVLAAASLEPAPFVALHLAIFGDGGSSSDRRDGSSDSEGGSSRRRRFAAAAREVEAMKRKEKQQQQEQMPLREL